MSRIRKYNESIDDGQIFIKKVEIISDIHPLKSGTKVEFN